MASSIDINKIVEILTQNQGEDLTTKGINKLRKYILDQATDLSNQATATLTPLLQKLNKDVCPDEKTINGITSILNNFIENINKKTAVIDKLSQPINSNIDLISNIKKTTDTIDLSITTATLAISLIPPPGLPGAIVSAVDILDTLRNKVLYNKTGSPRIPQLSTPLTGAFISIAIFNTFIEDIVTQINQLLNLLKKCITQYNLNLNITPFSSITLKIVEKQKQTVSNINNSQYQGFIIEIEEKDYTPTVKQRRAVGKNNQGITLISTPYSFTTNNQVLIDELKFIIGRDNLKAY